MYVFCCQIYFYRIFYTCHDRTSWLPIGMLDLGRSILISVRFSRAPTSKFHQIGTRVIYNISKIITSVIILAKAKDFDVFEMFNKYLLASKRIDYSPTVNSL